MTIRLDGVFAPVVSTFSAETGELDVAGFAANIRAHMAAGLHGVVVAGSTGEAALLDAAERGALVEAARENVSSDRLVIAGTGAESTRTCLALTRDAAARGADAVLVVAPHYYSSVMTEPALSQHYLRVADESPVPVVLYNIPKYMHFAIPATLVGELAKHENVVGIKDSSGNREMLTSYLVHQSDTFHVVNGNGGQVQFSMESGARGGILAVALFAAALSLEVFEAARRGDSATASAGQARLTPIAGKIVGEMGIAGVKAAMDRVGLHGGPVRSPLLPLSSDKSREVDDLLRAAEVGGLMV
jgi:4-hydroxy-2-oxoglutarate aldolase